MQLLTLCWLHKHVLLVAVPEWSMCAHYDVLLFDWAKKKNGSNRFNKFCYYFTATTTKATTATEERVSERNNCFLFREWFNNANEAARKKQFSFAVVCVRAPISQWVAGPLNVQTQFYLNIV